MVLYCKCGQKASLCTYNKIQKKSNGSVGLLLYSKNNQLQKYADQYNSRIEKWLNNGFYEHMHLCNGTDIMIGLIYVNYEQFFGNLDPNKINNPIYYNNNAQYIQDRLTKIIEQKLPYIFEIAKYNRKIYGSKYESKVHMELSWTLVGRKCFEKRQECGALQAIYNIFKENPECNLLLQIAAPNGVVINNYKRYWDIKIHISSCGKIEDNESKENAIIRETAEEIDLDVSKIKWDSPLNYGVHLFIQEMDEFNFKNYYLAEEKKWNGYCYNCEIRKSTHNNSFFKNL